MCANLSAQSVWNYTLLNSISYGKISICQAEFSYAPSKLFVQTLTIDKYNKIYKRDVCSSINFLKNPSIYQNNRSQVLVHIPVKITIMNKF